jgi:ribosomal protein S27E
MATKKKDADAAYLRGEAQRALVKVLEAAEAMAHGEYGWTDTSTVAAIDVVRSTFLTVTAPAKSKELPGQLGIDGTIVGAAEKIGKSSFSEFMLEIETCPACGKHMLDGNGGSWTPLRPHPEADHALQCGFCGKTVLASTAQWTQVVELRRRAHAHTDTVKSPVIPEKKSRARGAG